MGTDQTQSYFGILMVLLQNSTLNAIYIYYIVIGKRIGLMKMTKRLQNIAVVLRIRKVMCRCCILPDNSEMAPQPQAAGALSGTAGMLKVRYRNHC